MTLHDSIQRVRDKRERMQRRDHAERVERERQKPVQRAQFELNAQQILSRKFAERFGGKVVFPKRWREADVEWKGGLAGVYRAELLIEGIQFKAAVSVAASGEVEGGDGYSQMQNVVFRVWDEVKWRPVRDLASLEEATRHLSK